MSPDAGLILIVQRKLLTQVLRTTTPDLTNSTLIFHSHLVCLQAQLTILLLLLPPDDLLQHLYSLEELLSLKLSFRCLFIKKFLVALKLLFKTINLKMNFYKV